MNDSLKHSVSLPLEQQAIRAKCFHPTGTFVEFKKEEIERSIPERFEKIVRMYPERVAVKTADEVVTYAELNAMANRLACRILVELGSAAEPVALLFEKGIGPIAAMLGVLKAGKFFVLLDSSFPQAKLATALDDGQATMLVADRPNISLALQLVTGGRRLINFESVAVGISSDYLQLPVASREMACVVYTSGSTGQPKGVIQSHRNLLHRTMLRTNLSHLCADDRIAHLTSGTSTEVTTIFYALLNGAALFLLDVKKEGMNDLASWLVQERISICSIASPLFRNLCENLTVRVAFSDLRFLRLISEAVYKSDVDLYKKYFPSTCIFGNGLSSSETGALREFFLDHNTAITGDEAPLGYALDGKEVCLLDDAGNEVGFNQVGEIAVRSPYLSPGYWRRPDLTEAKFKADPDGSDKRMYFTGDLGLMRPDGCLIYKGRKDLRVKIRGYGVEIAEVEKVLREHSAVRDVIVVARENHLGESRLVAYFESPAQPIPSVSELRNYMKAQLPDYMIPSAFVFLESMPLTPNGKVDRRALPDPGNSRPELDAPYVAPRFPLEKKLAQIWANVLAVDHVGIHDNFFDLGGHSLAATRVVTQVIKKFQLDLPLHALFRVPTLAEMAVVLREHEPKKLEQNDLDRILTELEALSEEDAQRVLSKIVQNEAS